MKKTLEAGLSKVDIHFERNQNLYFDTNARYRQTLLKTTERHQAAADAGKVRLGGADAFKDYSDDDKFAASADPKVLVGMIGDGVEMKWDQVLDCALSEKKDAGFADFMINLQNNFHPSNVTSAGLGFAIGVALTSQSMSQEQITEFVATLKEMSEALRVK